jgi:hypothetical protein
VPFKDFAVGDWEAAQHDDPLEYAGAVSALPSSPKLRLRCYQGTWVLEPWVPGIIAIQRGGGFTPRHGDVVLASMPKCGSVWLKALAFATMARSVHPPAGNPEHPLLRLTPDDCVPSMEKLFATERGSKAMEALPSPRLMATHMQHSVLTASICEDSRCKIVYICRWMRYITCYALLI